MAESSEGASSEDSLIKFIWEKVGGKEDNEELVGA